MRNRFVGILIVMGVLIACASYVRAEDALQRYRVTLYLTPFINYNSFSGDKFDGNWFITASNAGVNEAIIIPKVDNALGYGGALGLKVPTGRWPVDLAFDIGFFGSQPKVSWGGIAGDAQQTELDLNFKVIFRSGKRLQPGVLLGYNIPLLTVKDASASTGGQVRDAKFMGKGYNVGALLSYYLNNYISLNWAFIHRWHEFEEVDGRIGRIKITEPLKATSMSGQISITFHWGLAKMEGL